MGRMTIFFFEKMCKMVDKKRTTDAWEMQGGWYSKTLDIQQSGKKEERDRGREMSSGLKVTTLP